MENACFAFNGLYDYELLSYSQVDIASLNTLNNRLNRYPG